MIETFPRQERVATPESIPTIKNIEDVFRILTGGLPYETVRQVFTEDNVYVWDITISNPDGGTIEFSYTNDRKKSPEPYIYKAFYDESGQVKGGHGMLFEDQKKALEPQKDTK